MLYKVLPFVGLALISVSAAERPDPKQLRSVAEAYLARRPAPALPAGIGYPEALRGQKDYVEALTEHLGPRAGLKVGLVTPAGQQRFGISHPIRGVLLQRMLLPNESTVPVSYGIRPIVEPDLMVRVKDARINEATTPEEVAQHLSEIICFIELADGTFPAEARLDAGALVASNVGARAGVLGESRKVESSPEFLRAFGQMRLVMRDGAGREISSVTVDGVMGHPLNAVLWLIQDLKRTDDKLEAGELISLGSPSPQITPKPGDKYVLIYEGLPGGPLKASVSFE